MVEHQLDDVGAVPLAGEDARGELDDLRQLVAGADDAVPPHLQQLGVHRPAGVLVGDEVAVDGVELEVDTARDGLLDERCDDVGVDRPRRRRRAAADDRGTVEGHVGAAEPGALDDVRDAAVRPAGREPDLDARVLRRCDGLHDRVADAAVRSDERPVDVEGDVAGCCGGPLVVAGAGDEAVHWSSPAWGGRSTSTVRRRPVAPGHRDRARTVGCWPRPSQWRPFVRGCSFESE